MSQEEKILTNEINFQVQHLDRDKAIDMIWELLLQEEEN